MKKLILLSVVVLFTTACSSGWSCQKRYVKQDKVLIIKNQRVC
jgi:uncharacterized lipoprotein